MGDPRHTHAWRLLRKQVVNEEPVCTVRLPGCTHVSTTADHIETIVNRPDLALTRSNLRGACLHCNSSLGATFSNRRRNGAGRWVL